MCEDDFFTLAYLAALHSSGHNIGTHPLDEITILV